MNYEIAISTRKNKPQIFSGIWLYRKATIMKFEFFTTDDGVKLGYMDKGTGIPVILLAGYSAPATSWYIEEKTFLKHGYRVIAFDRRSHGSSEHPPYGQDMATQG
jgi:alpha-beta hydrolase superfamily lysophospholipase